MPSPSPTAAKFVNWESPHVSPLALSPDAALLLAVNTPDNSLHVFDLTTGAPVATARIPVGLDPVSVRARSQTEAWVVNRISDGVSVVNLASRTVVRTLRVGDEPGDVVFAGGRAFVSCLEPSRVLVFDPERLDIEPTVLPVQAHDPRAMAVSPDGSTVYVSIFESGNHTTLVYKGFVSEEDGPYGGQNPPPNSGSDFSPPLNPDLLPPAKNGQIVRKDVSSNRWLDDNGRDWSTKVTWDLHDHDLAIIDVNSLNVRYLTGLMNINMHLTARPDGKVVVVGTEAINQIRFEPNLTGRFVRTIAAIVDPAGNDTDRSKTIFDLNPHLATAYQQKAARVDPSLRDGSIADPRGIVWRSDGSAGYITAMGTNNIIMIDSGGARLAQTDVGEGPTGVVLDEPRNQLYVFNRFESSLSVLDSSTLSEKTRVPLFDPSPPEIREGRPFLYNARRTSGLGVTACASCHVDARTDGLAWDLGNPTGQMKAFDQNCDTFRGLQASVCEDFNPVKGPMTTQSLQGIIGMEPFHWRGDRQNLTEFNPAFMSLLGGDTMLSDDEMARLSAFLATIRYPSNPFRNLDGSLAKTVGDGIPADGEIVFTTGTHDHNLANCNFCHAGAFGSNRMITPQQSLDGVSFKVPQLRGLYKKTGFFRDSQQNDRGFGFSHDGVASVIPEFLSFRAFFFAPGAAGEQQKRDVQAFLLSFATETHPAVGTQVTLDGSNDTGDTASLVDLMLRLADDKTLGLVAHGQVSGEPRAYAYTGHNMFQSDRDGEQIQAATLRLIAAFGAEITWTAVPEGSEIRIGIDHNDNGILDGDEKE